MIRIENIPAGAGRLFLIRSSAGNRCDDNLDQSARSCEDRKVTRKQAGDPHKTEVGKQHAYNPYGQARADGGLHSGAKAGPDGGINPDQHNAKDESQHIELYDLVGREFCMPERLHPVSPAMRQQHAVYKVTEDVVNDPGNDATDEYTTQVDFSHTFSLSVSLM